MTHDLATRDLDAMTIQLEADMRTQAMVHRAQMETFQDGGLPASTAIVSAHRSTMLARALADGKILGGCQFHHESRRP